MLILILILKLSVLPNHPIKEIYKHRVATLWARALSLPTADIWSGYANPSYVVILPCQISGDGEEEEEEKMGCGERVGYVSDGGEYVQKGGIEGTRKEGEVG